MKRNVFMVLLVLLSLVLSSSSLAGQELSADGPGADEVKGGMYLYLKAGAFDPLGSVPRLPDSLSLSPAEAEAAGVYLLQFTGPVMPEWKRAVKSAGGQLGGYVPDHAFLAELDSAAMDEVRDLPFVRWVGAYQPAYKVAADADYDDARSYRILLAPWAEGNEVENALKALSIKARPFSQGFVAVLNGDKLDQVARLADVVWIEPVQLQRAYNDIGGGTIMGGGTAWGNGYTGDGVTVAIADTGLDTGNASTVHQDFAGRVTHISSWPLVYANYGGGCETANTGANDGAADLDSGHGTHVAGSVAGSGAESSDQLKGLGYEASVTFQAVEQYTTWTGECPDGPGYYLTGLPDDSRELLDEAYTWGARIHNDSWGGGSAGVYDQVAQQFDDFIHQHPDMAVVVAAGNEGVDGDADGYVDENSISSPATAKNLISVGASDNERSSGGYQFVWGTGSWSPDYPADPTRNDYISDNREELAAFSSRGPMADGRIKPDVVAPGTNILSTKSSQTEQTGWGAYDQYYMYMGGTSMASPLTAGAATVVREYYVAGEGHANPSAALIKATLINSAVDIVGYGYPGEEANQPIPNNHEGWGRVNVGAATTPGSRQFEDDSSGINVGVTRTFDYDVRAGQPFKVTLVWSDAPAAAYAGRALVNNLNLRVTAPDGTTSYWGNHFSGGWAQTGGSADSINNVENVYIQSPAAGAWKVEVIGAGVPQGPQPFALVVDGDLVTEPLSVTAIQPTRASNTAVLSGAVISGTGFRSTTAVYLIRASEVVTGTGAVVDTESDTITANFNLLGATAGLWTVRVSNSALEIDSLANAFEVYEELTVMGIEPDHAPNNALLADVVVSGTGFENSAQVYLVRNGEVITGSVSARNTNADTITADFDLDGATIGWWDVRVANSVTDSAVLADAFLVIDASLPNLNITKTAQQAEVVSGSWLTYTIVIQNSGVVSATEVVFTDTLPNDAAFEWMSPECLGGTVALPDGSGFSCQVGAGTAVMGAEITYTLVVSVAEDADGTLTNRVVVGSKEADGYANDNSDEASVTAKPKKRPIFLPLVMLGWPPIPPAPVLDPVSGGSDDDGNYDVSWSASTHATDYLLEEAINTNFDSARTVYDGPNRSISLTGREYGTYYYRVKAYNEYAASGWSNTQSVVVAPPLPSTLASIADGDVLEGYPTNNSGAYTEMWVGYDDYLDPDGKIARSFAKFDTSGIPAGTTIGQATLRLYLSGSWDYPDRTRTITIYRVGSPWTEPGLTWNTQPAIQEAYGSTSVAHGADVWYGFDVTALVQGWVNGTWNNYGLAIRGPEYSGVDSSWKSFFTREEGGYAPYIALSYTAQGLQGTLDAGLIESEATSELSRFSFPAWRSNGWELPKGLVRTHEK